MPTSGRGAQLFNVGEIVNKGWELSLLAYPIETRDLSLRLSGSLNTLDNEVTDNGGTAPFSVGGFTFLGQWIEEGQPVGYLRGDRPIFDDEGNWWTWSATRRWGARSRTCSARSAPTLASSTASKSSSRPTTRSVRRASPSTMCSASSVASRTRTDSRRAPDGSIPALDQGTFFDLAGVWVEDTDFLKVRLISLSYDVPSRWFRNPVLRSLKVGARVVNPFNVVASSFDPEVTGANGQSGTGGVQNGVNLGVFGFGTESPPRQFLFSVKAGF